MSPLQSVQVDGQRLTVVPVAYDWAAVPSGLRRPPTVHDSAGLVRLLVGARCGAEFGTEADSAGGPVGTAVGGVARWCRLAWSAAASARSV